MKALTAKQLAELQELEPQLMQCVKTGAFDQAESLAKKIKLIFGRDNTHHRFLRALNWYAECAIEAHYYQSAVDTLDVVRQRAKPRTRLYVEATGLQTLAYLRLKKYAEAKEGARLVIEYLNRITSDAKRRQFQKRFIERVQEECTLAGLSGVSSDFLDPERIHEKAVEFVQQKNEHEIMALIENQMPGEAILLMKDVTDYSILQLPPNDRRFLMPPGQDENHSHFRQKCASALKRVTWKTFCNPDSEIFKLWSKKMPKVFDAGYFAASLTATFKEWKIGYPLVVAGLVAVAVKYGCEEFCKVFKPNSLMIPASEKEKKT